MIIDPHEIPESWAFTTMGEISTAIGGGTPKTKEPNNYAGGNMPWLIPADLSGYTGKKIGHGSRLIKEKRSARSARMFRSTGRYASPFETELRLPSRAGRPERIL